MLYTLLRLFILLKCVCYTAYYYYFNKYYEMTESILKGGAVPIKIAQWISQRKDLFSKECYQVLNKVCTDTIPHDNLYTLKSLERMQLKIPITDWEITPLGSGSIAQVYKAKYNNKPCIIKVRHPGIQMQMETDIYILNKLVILLCFFGNKYLAALDIKNTLKNILKQCNLKNEARNTNLLAQCFYENPYITFPKILYKNSEILIESYSSGYHSEEFYQKYPEYFLKAKAVTLAAYMQMFLVNGVIHADCHQGNIKYEVDERKKIKVHFLDCGVITKLNYNIRQHIIELMNILMVDEKKQLLHYIDKLSKTPINKSKFQYLMEKNIHQLQQNTKNNCKLSISAKINMLLNLLAETNACIDSQIISFLIGYSLIESIDNDIDNDINKDVDNDSLTKQAFTVIKNSKYFKTTRNNAYKMEKAIKSITADF